MTYQQPIAPWETWEWEVPPGTTSSSLAETVDRSTDDLVTVVRSLPEGAMETPRTLDAWSGRDALAHCVAWTELCSKVLHELATDTLEMTDYGQLPVGDANDDELNQRQVDGLSAIATPELVDRLQRARTAAAATLRSFPGDAPAELVLLTFGDHLDDHANARRGLAANGA